MIKYKGDIALIDNLTDALELFARNNILVKITNKAKTKMFSHYFQGNQIMDYSYSYDPDTNQFKLYVNDMLAYSFAYCDPMTDKEADRLAEDLFIEWKENV